MFWNVCTNILIWGSWDPEIVTPVNWDCSTDDPMPSFLEEGEKVKVSLKSAERIDEKLPPWAVESQFRTRTRGQQRDRRLRRGRGATTEFGVLRVEKDGVARRRTFLERVSSRRRGDFLSRRQR